MIEVSFVGYNTQKTSVILFHLGEEATLNVFLAESTLEIGEVIALVRRIKIQFKSDWSTVRFTMR